MNLTTTEIKIGFAEWLKHNKWEEVTPKKHKSPDKSILIETLSDGINIKKVVGNKNVYLTWRRVTDENIQEVIKNLTVTDEQVD
jgi:hypothetical protein